MKKLVSIVLLLVILSTGAVILGPGMVDWNKYKPEITGRLHDVTGHDYQIAGNIEFGIIPAPRLKIDQLSIRMPADMGGDTVLSLERAAVDVELVPLFSKQIVVKSVELLKPVFNIGVKADGTATWMTPALQQKLNLTKVVPEEPRKEMSSGIIDAVAFNEVRIREGSFTYSNLQTSSKTSLDKIDIDVKADSLMGPYNASGQMMYLNQPVKVVAKTGKMSDKAATSAQVEITLADGSTALTFSGVFARQPVFELQGEAGLKSSNLSDALKIVTGKDNPSLAKSVSATGLLTFKPGTIEYKNALLNVAGAEAAASLTLLNFDKGETGKPLDLALTLKSEKPVVLDGLLPSGSARTDQGFIPSTVSLPMDMVMKADIDAKALEYKGATFTGVTLTSSFRGKEFSGVVKAVTPGQGKIDTRYALRAGSVSKTASGGVILADLKLMLDGMLQANVPQALIKPFVAEDALKGTGTLLSAPASSTYSVTISPALINIESAKLGMLDTDMAVSGTFQPAHEKTRGLLNIKANAASLDADAWLKRLNPQKQDAVAPEPSTDKAGVDVAGIAKKLTLPIDLDMAVSLGSLTLKGQAYDKVALQGRLINNRLTIDSASLAASGGNSIVLAGSVGDVSALKDVDLTLQGKTGDLEKTLRDMKVDTKSFPQNVGAAEVLAEFKGQPDNLSFVANFKALKGSLETSGILDDLMTEPKFSNLVFRMKHPNYVELGRILNPNFKSNVAINKNLDVYASMNRQGLVYTLKDFQATVGPSTLTGQVTYDAGAARPKLVADLEAGDLALSDIVGYEKKPKSAGTVQAQTSAGGDNVRWSRNAINTAWMRQYDADIKLEAKSLTWVNWRMDEASLESKLSNGVLSISHLGSRLYGGTLAAKATVTAPAAERAPLTIVADTRLDNVSLESFVSSFSGSNLVKAKGTINLDAAIETAGVSPAALVFALKGKGGATGESLVFDGFDLARMSRTLVQPSSSWKENALSLLDNSMAGGQTSFDKMDVAYTITEGVVNFDKLTLTGDAANINSTGKVNLPLWTIDLENTIKLVEPADAPPLKTSFRGPLDNPAKTFAKSAFDSYMGSQLERALTDVLQDKLKDKGLIKAPAAVTPSAGGNVVTPQQPAQPQNVGDVFKQLIQDQVAPQVAPAPVAPANPVPAAPVPESAPVVPEAAPTPAPVDVAPVDVAPAAPQPAPVEAAPVEAAPAESAPAPQGQDGASAAPQDTANPEDQIRNLIEGLTDQ